MADLCVSLLPGDHPAFLFQLIPEMDGSVGNPGDFTGQVFFGLDSDGIDLDQRQIVKHLFLYNARTDIMEFFMSQRPWSWIYIWPSGDHPHARPGRCFSPVPLPFRGKRSGQRVFVSRHSRHPGRLQEPLPSIMTADGNRIFRLWIIFALDLIRSFTFTSITP